LYRTEAGESRIDVHLVRSMMDLYDYYADDLIEQTRQALKPRWFRVYGPENMGYVDVETEASLACEFAVQNVPGLLQTEAYMRALFDRHRLRRTPEQLENDVEVRLIRQRRLTGEEDPLELVAVIDEAALGREVGGPEVMREQLRHLVEMARLPTVTLQVLSLRDGPHSAMDGAFTLLSFPEPGDPDLLYISYATGSLHIENDKELATARLMFDQLRGEALNPADSVALIERLAAELYGP
jgi:hypothetical protein